MPYLKVNGKEVGFITYTANSMDNAGRIRPLVLFIHGAGTASHRWRHQVQSLGATYFCMAVDLPWHGGSEGLADFPTVANYADFIEALWEGVSARWHNVSGLLLAGEQLGAAIGLELALRRPPYLKGLVLASAACRMPVSREWLSVLRQGIVPMEMAVQIYHPLPYTYWQKEHALDVEHCPAPIRYLDHLALHSFDRSEELAGISVPTLILNGSHDQVLDKESVEKLHQGIRGAHLEIISGGGHALPVQRPNETSQAISRFLNAYFGKYGQTEREGSYTGGRG